MIDLIVELCAFMRVRKKYWMIPMLVVVGLLGMLIVLAEGSAVAPFIYTIF
ncbi:MAG: DUF5989 family protein [Alphaproteobacteria bacterium]